MKDHIESLDEINSEKILCLKNLKQEVAEADREAIAIEEQLKLHTRTGRQKNLNKSQKQEKRNRGIKSNHSFEDSDEDSESYPRSSSIVIPEDDDNCGYGKETDGSEQLALSP